VLAKIIPLIRSVTLGVTEEVTEGDAVGRAFDSDFARVVGLTWIRPA